MRSSKLNYMVVGLFVIAMAGVLIGAIALLTGRTGAVDNYYAVYSNVTGVKFGTQVIYEGYPIGQVEKVTPEPQDGGMVFRVDFSVQEGWKIPKDSRVEIAAPSLLSAKTLSVHAGKSKAALSPGDAVTTVGSGDVFGAMSSLASTIANLVDSEVKPLLQNVSFAVNDINSFLVKDGSSVVKDISGLVQETSAFVADIKDRIPRIAEDIEIFTANMNQASEEVRKLASKGNRRQIEVLLRNMDATVGQVQDVLVLVKKVAGNLDALVVDPKKDIQALMTETRYIVDSVSRHIDSINQNMEGAARNMNEFSRQIRANPGLLLGGTPQQDAGK